MTVSVYDISLWSDENVDDGYTKNNWIIHLNRYILWFINYMPIKLLSFSRLINWTPYFLFNFPQIYLN
jgi:hypothetical protein